MTLTVKNAASDRPSLYLYGEIGDEWGGITSDMFRKELAAIDTKKPLDLHIDTVGGNFFQGVAMHSLLTQRQGPVHVHVDGLAASAGSVVAMAGRTIQMARGSAMMIHEARLNYMPDGRAEDHRKMADLLEAINSTIVGIYSKRWKGSEDELRSAIGAETWLFDDKAVELGLADSVAEALAVAARVGDVAKFKYLNVPKLVRESPPIPPGLAAIGDAVDELFPEESAA